MNKKEIRNIYKSKRLEISQLELNKRSKEIAIQLLKKFNLKNKIVSLFLPIENQNEINTYYIWEEFKKLDSKTVISKSNFETKEMVHYRFISKNQLEINKYGIPEPINGEIINEKEIDYVIVPMMAFDDNGNRIGYGKGFYDRFLNKCSEKCVFIGVNLFEHCETIDDINPTDIKLHYCITPTKTYKFIQ